MKVRELIEKLNEIDEDVEIIVVRQIDNEHQQYYNIASINDKHPCGAITVHLSEYEDECEA